MDSADHFLLPASFADFQKEILENCRLTGGNYESAPLPDLRLADQKTRLKNPIYKRFIQETHVVFMKVRQTIPHLGELSFAEQLNRLINLSIAYRAVAHSAVDSLTESINSKPDSDFNKDEKDLRSIIRCGELLCGVFQVMVMWLDEMRAADHLKEWARVMILTNVREAMDAAQKNEDALLAAVFLLVLSFDFAEAQALLSTHPHAQKRLSPEQGMCEILKELARTFDRGCDTRILKSVQKTIKKEFIGTNVGEKYEVLAKILLGDEETTKTFAARSDFWWEIVPLYTAMKNPDADFDEFCMNAADVGAYVHLTVPQEKHTRLGQVLLTALEGNLNKALYAAPYVTNDWWFSAHYVDLMYNVAPSQLLVKKEFYSQRNKIVGHYTNAILTKKLDWKIKADYIRSLPHHTPDLEMLLLQQIPNEIKQAVQLYEASKQWELPYAKHAITAKISHYYLEKGNNANCLRWAAKNGSPGVISMAVDTLLQSGVSDAEILEAMEHIKISSDSLLCQHLCPELKLFMRYHQYLLARKEDNIECAFIEICAVFEECTIPFYMYSRLLYHLKQCVEQCINRDKDEVVRSCSMLVNRALGNVAMQMERFKQRGNEVNVGGMMRLVETINFYVSHELVQLAFMDHSEQAEGSYC